jgi:hypothetical protein
LLVIETPNSSPSKKGRYDTLQNDIRHNNAMLSVANKPVMLNIFMLGVFMLYVIMLRVILLFVVLLIVIMLSVNLLYVVVIIVIMLCHFTIC